MVTFHELQNLREALAKGGVPPDLERKLARLAAGGLSHRFIEQNCRTIIELLLVSYEGLFRHISHHQRERLLRVLAYVRKEDDAVADYRPDGYNDDQQELRAALIELMPALQSFKAWRLQHQVPAMW
jgi:hypothetical protein